jgi:hypothetical protein
MHVAVTRYRTDAWIAQLREATSCGERPRFLLRDNDSTYGSLLARVAATSRIEIRKTPLQAPRANASGERFLGSVSRARFDRLPVLDEHHVHRVIHESVRYFKQGWSH